MTETDPLEEQLHAAASAAPAEDDPADPGPEPEDDEEALHGQHVVDVGTGQLVVDNVAPGVVAVHYNGRGVFHLAGDELRQVADFFGRVAGR